ncbi:hypothetical protein GCM10009571_17860 [Agromyces luteolus]|uniref:hypothetical protein n=1 Tax=Agromyces luteolus TaxID=88373 RepID=UPI0014126353|nr:hypothetical protein [Agromyces luteolus]
MPPAKVIAPIVMTGRSAAEARRRRTGRATASGAAIGLALSAEVAVLAGVAGVAGFARR